MQIIFSNGEQIELVFNQSPIVPVYQKIYKHLQNVDVPFDDWDSPCYFYNHSLDQLVAKLVMYADKLGVPIDQKRCLDQDQGHLNALHEIYENSGDSGQQWSDFHRHLHMCEKDHAQETVMQKTLKIDYKHKSGLLEKPFDIKWLRYGQDKVKKGDVFICWQELGKTPYLYWSQDEPNDLVRMQQVIKPWITLKPNIYIALEDIDLKNDKKNLEEFEIWWNQYSQALCQHWNMLEWNTDDMFKCLVFGSVPDTTSINELLQNNAKPVRVIL
jgi:hypothetical protein